MVAGYAFKNRNLLKQDNGSNVAIIAGLKERERAARWDRQLGLAAVGRLFPSSSLPSPSSQTPNSPLDPLSKLYRFTYQLCKVNWTRGRKFEEEEMDARYWCHMCSQMVNPVMGVEIKCPFCDSGFVEEMDDRGGLDAADLGSDRALSLWAPILLGMLGSSRRQRRLRMDDEDEDSDYEWHRDLEAILRRRRRSSAFLQLLQAIRAGNDSGSEGERGRDRDRDRERESVLLIDPFDQAIILQGSFDTDGVQNSNTDAPAGASLGDYFVGPSLDLLLQHLAENDPNRYGTPPAQKEAVEALPTVKVEENLGCPVCLEDFELGAEAKEMPCKHRFHSGCILPWLELHSSCPVCRLQIPADGTKDTNGPGNGNRVEGSGGDMDAENDGNGRRFWLPVPWPFNEVFSLPGSQGSGNGNSSASASGSNSHEDNN